jgi:hypothetical protein
VSCALHCLSPNSPKSIHGLYAGLRASGNGSTFADGADPDEVKATSRPRLCDATHLRTFRTEYGKKARAGLLLHTGTTFEWLTPDVLAAPWWSVL